MRTLLLLLVLANLLFAAFELDAFGDVLGPRAVATPVTQLNAEKLRIVRDTSNRNR